MLTGAKSFLKILGLTSLSSVGLPVVVKKHLHYICLKLLVLVL